MIKIFTNTTFTGHWGVGTSAVVIAHSAHEAANLLNERLSGMGLPGDAKVEDMDEILDLKSPGVFILQDGNY